MTENKNTSKDLSNNVRVFDALEKNWVDQFCPSFAQPYLRLSRADRPAGTWLLLIPCWWGILLAMLDNPNDINPYDLWLFIACAIGAFLMRGAGCTWNDINDRHIDAQVFRTKSRPLPSGQITLRNAILWMITQTCIAFLILLSFNLFSILLGIAALIPVFIYPFAKRFTWWPQVFLGIAFNWGALLGWTIYNGHLGISPIFLYASGIFWTIFYDTIYALQDKEDDAMIGVKSTARLFGRKTKTWLLAFAFFTIISFGLAVFNLDNNPWTLSVLTITIIIFFLHLIWQLFQLKIDNPTLCLKLFRTNKDAGFIIIGGFIIAIIVQYKIG